MKERPVPICVSMHTTTRPHNLCSNLTAVMVSDQAGLGQPALVPKTREHDVSIT